MKEKFKEHYQYTDKELAKLWNEAYFVFDTSTLLNMYRYNRDTFNEYLKVLKELSDNNKLFLPNHVGKEFFRNRIKVIQDYKKSYSELVGIINKFKSELSSKYRHHPFVDIENVSKATEDSLKQIEEEIKNKEKVHPDWIKQDDILDKLTSIFSSCVGDPYSEQELVEIYKEGETRYQKKIPPGYKDIDKGEDKQYGDLIVWKQILDFAKTKNKPIIFITGDVKEDWWLINEGERLMPLPALKREIRLFASVDFHAYTADYFLETYNKHNKTNGIDKKAIDEVRKLRKIQDSMLGNNEVYSEKFIYGKEKNERYELLSLSIPRILEIFEHIYEIVPDLSEEEYQSLESIDRIIRTISRSVRAHGRVSNFHIHKIDHWLYKAENLIQNHSISHDMDDVIQRRLENYILEIQKIRGLLGRGRNNL